MLENINGLILRLYSLQPYSGSWGDF